MATTQNVTSTYAGKDAGVYISAAFKASDTFDKGIIEFMPNVKYKSVLHKLALTDASADYACDFTAAGAVTLTEAIIEPKKLMLNLELCKENYVNTWESDTMGFGADNDNLPTTFQEFLIAKVLEKQAEKVDANIWSGDGSVAGEFSGFTTLWAADASVLVPTGATSGQTITSSNVIAQMAAMYDLIPDAILNSPNLKWVVATNVAKAYKRALSTLGYGNTYSQGDKPLDFEGIELTVVGGLPASNMAIFEKDNLYFGTGLMEDFNEVSVLDMKAVDLSGNIRFKMAYSAGVQYVIPSEIVAHIV